MAVEGKGREGDFPELSFAMHESVAGP